MSEIEYTIYGVGPDGTLGVVTGHGAVSLDVGSCVWDTLQTGAPWDKDASGYSFRHSPDPADNHPFPHWGREYMVVYQVTLTAGDPIVWRWMIRTP